MGLIHFGLWVIAHAGGKWGPLSATEVVCVDWTEVPTHNAARCANIQAILLPHISITNFYGQLHLVMRDQLTDSSLKKLYSQKNRNNPLDKGTHSFTLKRQIPTIATNDINKLYIFKCIEVCEESRNLVNQILGRVSD